MANILSPAPALQQKPETNLSPFTVAAFHSGISVKLITPSILNCHAYSQGPGIQISQHKEGQHLLKQSDKFLPYPSPKLETEHFKAEMNKTRNVRIIRTLAEEVL